MDIFKYVDEVVSYYRTTRPMYKEVAKELKQSMEDAIVRHSKYTLSVSSRVKDPDSVREKLIRNSYYRIHTTKEEIIANVQDLIGLRIECKFTEDEAYVYSLFVDLFSKTDDQIYFYNEEFPKMRFKLSEPQPVKQKNGFDIYKIDGRYEDKEDGNNLRVNFEVQIKSLVNMFWGEVEHRIIYKNPSYFMMEQQVVDALTTVKANLDLVDHQLHKLYRQYKREYSAQVYSRKENMESILSKVIHDMFARKMRNELGFVVQFKETCDSIVDYMFIVNNAAQMEDYGRVMTEIFYRTGNLTKQEISFREPIVLKREIRSESTFVNTVAVTIQRMVNVDFNWHLFFVILFELEGGSNADALEAFLRYYQGRIASGARVERLRDAFEPELASQIKNDLMTEMGYVFRRHVDISLLYKEGMDALSAALARTIDSIVRDRPDDWHRNKSMYFLYLNNSVDLTPEL